MTTPSDRSRLLVVTAVEAERAVIAAGAGVLVVAGGIGRTNAAAQTVQSLLEHGRFSAVISAGIAGALPRVGSGGATVDAEASERHAMLDLGTVVVATSCVYAEEGLITPEGFRDMTGLGFRLGDFEGNAVPVDQRLLRAILARLATRRDLHTVAAPIATVATCSGSDAAALEIARRTGAVAEAMEGAAVVHAARRLGVPAIEIRVISNTTGSRAAQRWDVGLALRVLGEAVEEIGR